MSQEGTITSVRKKGRTCLTEVESKELLRKAGIDSTKARLALSKEEATEISRTLGFPVVLKIVSPDIIHKSDAGGVKLGLKTSKQVGKAYDEILASLYQQHPGAVVDGISVQKMAKPGIEVIIGMSKDAHFGPVLMFGLGGILVEIIKDVSFRIVPLTRRDAREMIREIKGYPLLEGYRSQPPVDIPFLEELLLRVSHFVEQNPEIKELDLNPIFAYSSGAMPVDARIILEDQPSS